MTSTPKIRVAVLYGGRSAEHEVSLISAANVIQHLDKSLFEVVPIGIDKEGTWFLGSDVLVNELSQMKPLRLQQEAHNMLFSPQWLGHAPACVESHALASMGDTSLFDVIFPVLHGSHCEDGTLQGLLEVANVPYVGCGVLASAVGMDKDVSKRLIQQAGLNVVPFVTITQGRWHRHTHEILRQIHDTLQYPLFVKPANTGSSIGIQKVKQPHALAAAIQHAFQYDTKILVEQGIDAMEIELAVLESLEEGADPLVSVPGQIQPASHHEFYSYDAKYLDEHGAELLIPAVISDYLSQIAKTQAKRIFETLNCEGMARVDLFLDRKTDQFYFNEINTIPGFTSISMYPKLMAASGMPYSQLLTHLIHLAVARKHRKDRLNYCLEHCV